VASSLLGHNDHPGSSAVHAVVLSAPALRQAFNNELRALMDMDVDSDSPFPALPAAAHAPLANTCGTNRVVLQTPARMSASWLAAPSTWRL